MDKFIMIFFQDSIKIIMHFIHIHALSIPLYLYYEKYWLMYSTSVIYFLSYMYWIHGRYVNMDRMCARAIIIYMNMMTYDNTYTLLRLIALCMYLYGNYVYYKKVELINLLNVYYHTPLYKDLLKVCECEWECELKDIFKDKLCNGYIKYYK